MNNRHRKTLSAIYADPVPANLDWSAIEALLLAIGCSAIEGGGSRVRFVKDGLVVTLHRPQPTKEAKRYQVRDVRRFLIEIGVEP